MPTAAGSSSNAPDVLVAPGSAPADLDKTVIRKVIRQDIQKIEYCYEQALLKQPDLQGKVTVRFVVEPDGTVSSSTGEGLDLQVAACVAGVVKTLQFPAPHHEVHVSYPFVFHSAK